MYSLCIVLAHEHAHAFRSLVAALAGFLAVGAPVLVGVPDAGAPALVGAPVAGVLVLVAAHLAVRSAVQDSKSWSSQATRRG